MSGFVRHLRSPSDVAGLIADSVVLCLVIFEQGRRLLVKPLSYIVFCPLPIRTSSGQPPCAMVL